MKFSYWGFISHLEVGSERYGFSNADHLSVTWVNAEIETFENIFRSFYIIMGIARKLQSVVSSTSLLVYKSLLGLKTELHEYENEIWEVSRLLTQNQCPLDQVRVLYELLWTLQHPLWHKPFVTHFRGINHFIILFRSFTLSFIHFRNISKPCVSYIN